VSNIKRNNYYYLLLLIIVSIISHFPFVLKGFGEIDATKIAVSVIDILNNGSSAAFANFYFTDVIPLYVLYLKIAMKLLNYNYSYLPAVMNYTNAVFGTLTVIPAYYLIRHLFGNSLVAFCSVLALIFAPSFYQSTIIGFPHLIAFFFFLMSLCFYLSGLDHDRKSKILLMMSLSGLFLTTAFLFKSDSVLAAATYVGILFMRKIKDKGKITGAFLIIFISGILFLLFRNLIIGSASGTTMSKEGMTKWYDYSLIIPSTFGYLKAQMKPVIYGAGVVTSCIATAAFAFYLIKRRFDIVIFILSWAALPIFFWLVMIGNNARHNMFTILPLLSMIVIFFHEKTPRYVVMFTLALIAGNFLTTSPSYSILAPSGDIFRSNKLLKERVDIFQSRAEEITDINENKIAVLGTFHNPHVIFELLRSDPSYKAVKVGREDYAIQTNNKQYLFIYFISQRPDDMDAGINYRLTLYDLRDYVFVSATYDLKPLRDRGFKTRTLDIIKKSEL
jgi:uncharacterized lipoprotein YehR (DUF1307 family)